MLYIQLVVIICCGIIAFQDFRERAVLWFLFPILAIALAVLHLKNNSLEAFLWFSLINFILVSVILLVLFLYTKYIMRKKFINVSFGIGDILFFYALTLGFPSITFIFIFVGSILFSIILFLIFKNKWSLNTVPLAGLMGLYLLGVFIINYLPNMPFLYLI